MAKSRVTFQNVLHTREFRHRFLSSMSESISQIVICSPFFDKLPDPFGNIVGFCRFMKVRGTENIQLVTRAPGADGAMTLDMAKTLVTQGVEIFIKQKPYFHAKLYHFEYERGYFRTFIGSANFTMGGFQRNYELVTELEGVGAGTECHREIARMQANQGAMPYHAWAARGRPRGDEGRE